MNTHEEHHLVTESDYKISNQTMLKMLNIIREPHQEGNKFFISWAFW